MTVALRRHWRDMGLVRRIVLMSLMLFLVVQLVGFSVLRSNIAANARTQIAHELAVGERVWLRVLAQNADKLRLGASVLAADFGFRSAVSSADLETVRSALDNHGSRIGARVTAQFDAGIRLRAISHSEDGAMDEAVLTAVARSLTGSGRTGLIEVVGGLPHQFVMVPMRAPLVIGWVLMGFPINQALANDMFDLLDIHLVVLTGAGADTQVAVSSLPPSALAGVPATAWTAPEVEVDGDTHVTRVVTLDGQGGRNRAVLLRSVDQVLAPFVRLQWVLFAITLGGLALFGVGSALTARRITQPLQRLLLSVQRLEEGDFESPLPALRRADEVGKLSRAFDHMRTSVAAQQAEVQRLAYWDRLTGLPNRERFRALLMEAIARHPTDSVSVVMLNIDRFKHVNDVLGYAFGDELLKAVALRLQAQMVGHNHHSSHSPNMGRSGCSDHVARLGGDVFGLLLCGTGGRGALALTQQIARAFEEPLALNGQTVDLSASMGVASWPTDADAPDLLLSRSEIAMHAAKAKTAGTLVYETSLDSSSSQNLSLLTDLRHALEHHELRLYLQPKIDVATGRVVAAEALVRWQHPQRGLVPPMMFIPFAEQTGFVRQLTLWMFEEAARHWASWQQPGQAIRVAINLSTRDLLDLEFPNRLEAVLVRHQVPTSGFCLEITESAIMDDPQRAENTLNRLSAQGFKLSIDDFGTGYSSLAYLKRLPVNELKIDKSFVMGMETDESDAKIVRSTIDLAHNLGLTVVAEGVENAAILTQLGQLQCDEAQGYHMSRPVPAADFVQQCDRWHRQLT